MKIAWELDLRGVTRLNCTLAYSLTISCLRCYQIGRKCKPAYKKPVRVIIREDGLSEQRVLGIVVYEAAVPDEALAEGLFQQL